MHATTLLAGAVAFSSTFFSAAASPAEKQPRYSPSPASASPTSSPSPSSSAAAAQVFTSYYETSTCDGPSITNSFPQGMCIDLPVPVTSWSSQPANAELTMLVYSGYRCSNDTMVEHLDASGVCFSGVMDGDGSTAPVARSICINCPY